jgi:hypothetical protein
MVEVRVREGSEQMMGEVLKVIAMGIKVKVEGRTSKLTMVILATMQTSRDTVMIFKVDRRVVSILYLVLEEVNIGVGTTETISDVHMITGLSSGSTMVEPIWVGLEEEVVGEFLYLVLLRRGLLQRRLWTSGVRGSRQKQRLPKFLFRNSPKVWLIKLDNNGR